jgi:hypothetical protein
MTLHGILGTVKVKEVLGAANGVLTMASTQLLRQAQVPGVGVTATAVAVVAPSTRVAPIRAFQIIYASSMTNIFSQIDHRVFCSIDLFALPLFCRADVAITGHREARW